MNFHTDIGDKSHFTMIISVSEKNDQEQNG